MQLQMLLIGFILFLSLSLYSNSLLACTMQKLKSEEWILQNISVRVRFAEQTFLGDDAIEKFNAFDTSLNFKLPCVLYQGDGWELGSNFMLSAGILKTFDKSAVTVSAVPELMLRTSNGRFTVNAGFGLAAFSRNKFGIQDFGGPVQVAITFGSTIELTQRWRIGYRFQHYSDGRTYGSDTTGADLHMIEVYYQF